MKVAFVGAGSWGTSLARVLAPSVASIVLWSRDREVVEEIHTKRVNSVYLPTFELPANIEATNDIRAIDDADIIVISTPTQYIAGVIREHNLNLSDKPVVSVSKGIERGTLRRISELLREEAGVEEHNFAVLTGPSHAEEVARETPTTVVAVSSNDKIGKLVQDLFLTPYFRVYHSRDVVGAELGGAFKNVIAISAGIVEGIGFGDNTKAALMTRGLAELVRLGDVLGADAMTFSGLSGLGDLIVTCTSKFSRNRHVGELIGQGQTLADIQNSMRMVAEGVASTESIRDLGRRHNVELPIVEQVYRILFEHVAPLTAIQELMVRESKAEIWH